MPKILFINSVCNGSTGTICKNLYGLAEKEGFECYIAFGRGEAAKGFNTIRIGSKLDVYSHSLKARLFDTSGFHSKQATIKFIERIKELKPDIIHLHNIHGYYINVEILFEFLKKHPEIKKIWTLHDCWAYTGHCAYYSYVNCEKWKRKCTGKCQNLSEYPKSFCSNVNLNFSKKKMVFTGVENLTIVTPSEWLKKEVDQSFLKNYKNKIINNGINISVFKNTASSIKIQYNIEQKKIILGVASIWDKRKGLESFYELSKILNEEYVIVLIGLNNKQIKCLPENIIGLKRTENVTELVKWYSVSEVLFNPTLEDNYPTVNLEAIACGTPVVTFNTGGSPEIASKNGYIIESLQELLTILEKPIKSKNVSEFISIEYCFRNYIEMYKG